MIDNPRLHTPSWEKPDLPDGYAACLSCGEVMTADQLLEECPGIPQRGNESIAYQEAQLRRQVGLDG